MPPKKSPPPDLDLTQTCRQIADLCGVAVSTAYRWKKTAGIQMRRGARGVQRVSLGLWGKLERKDWEKGYSHVGRLMGVSPQAVHQMRSRLVKAGHDIPKQPRGQPSFARRV